MSNQITYFGRVPTDISVGMTEYQSTTGNIFSISSGIQTITSPNYFWMGFKTPSIPGYSYLAGFDISKTGDELLVQLVGNDSGGNQPTIVGTPSTTTNVFSLNFIYDKTCPYTLTQAVSTVATISGGQAGGDVLMSGVSQGNVYSSQVQSNGQIVTLKPSNQYMWKITALGSSTKFTFKYILSFVPQGS